jgi:hypothetical protein
MLTQFRKISLLMAYAVATIPLWHYISEAHILLLMTAVIIFAYLNVVLSSVDAAKAILSSEKAKTPLPRCLPKKPKYEKWWLIVRHTLKWHLLLVPAKMDLALGLTQWLFTRPVNLVGDFQVFTNLYTYISYNRVSYDPLIPSIYLSYPQEGTIFIAISTISISSLLETFIIASLILATRKQDMVSIKFIGLRSFIGLGLFGLLILVYALAEQMYSGERFWVSPCSWYLENPREDQREFFNNAEIDCIKKRFSETILLALATPIDQSIMLSANIMRPNIDFGVGDFSFETFTLRDNRLFVLRQCVAGILGIFLYLGTTWTILWFAEDERLHEQSDESQAQATLSNRH